MDSSEVQIPYTPAEWNRVASLIKSQDLAELQECKNYLQMWDIRMGDNTPIAVTCSGMFVMGAIKELQLKENQADLNELKLFHGMTIIRFVNYVSEINKSRDHTLSIIKSCEMIGIPQWIVEIRHNSSHLFLPPIETLRKAIKFCFNWIYDRFWSKPMHEAIVSVGGCAKKSSSSESATVRKLRESIRNSLIAFKNWRFNNMLATNYDTNLNPILAAVHKHIVRDPHMFMNILVTNEFLVMDDRAIRNTGFILCDNWAVPNQIQVIWKPVLQYISDADLLAKFVEELLTAKLAATERKMDEIQLTAWVNLMLTSALDPDLEVFSAEEWTSILYKMVACPSGIPTITVENVMHKVPNVDIKVRRKVRRIMGITHNDSMNEESFMTEGGSQGIGTVADLERLMQEKARKNKQDRFGLFEVYDEIDDGALPQQMGLAPGQTYDTVSLVLTADWLADAEADYERKQKDKEAMLGEIAEVVEADAL